MVPKHCKGKYHDRWCQTAKAWVYCERTNTTPKEFVTSKKEDTLLDYVSFLEKSGYAPSYIEDILKALRSWLSFNYVKLVRKIKIKNADISVTLEDEEISSKTKLRDVLDSASSRERVVVSFVALASVRLFGSFGYLLFGHV